MLETWKPVVGYEGEYLVSDFGRIMQTQCLKGTWPGRILLTSPNGSGYLHTRLGGKQHLVHRVVARAFIGRCPAWMEVNHKDGKIKNNCPDNLEYVTPHENWLHAAKFGLRDNVKLNEEAVIAICASREPTKVLAARYKVTRHTLWMARTGKTWKHVERRLRPW